jgi:hypothetical protein
MTRIVPFLREMEHQAEAGNLANAPELARKVSEEFQRIRVFLEAHLARQSALTPQT